MSIPLGVERGSTSAWPNLCTQPLAERRAEGYPRSRRVRSSRCAAPLRPGEHVAHSRFGRCPIACRSRRMTATFDDKRATPGRLSLVSGMTASTRLLRRYAPRNDMAGVVIASGAKQSRSRAALRCSDIFEPMQKSLFNSPSPPLGAERVGVRWGSGRSVVAASPTSPSPSLTRRVPSLSPRKRAERAKLRDGQDASENV
jgi:hypothetical protein